MIEPEPNNPPPSSSPSATGEVLATNPPPPPRDLTGKTLGDFRVERLIGRGGMGEVYRATQISLNRPVALKVLRPELGDHPRSLNRFEVEAMAVARLNHPNIVQVYTLGSFDELRFIAMEYVPGTNLRDYIAKKGTIDLPLALSIMRQAGQAIAAAGEIGLIHRDLKPENLLLTKKGQVKVADFGLCREQGVENLRLTQEGSTVGTPLYMSPEQFQGKPLDHRSDLYSLGVTFYHMLAGTVPFRGETAVVVAMKHLREPPVDLVVHRPDLPAEVGRLVMKLMAKAPEDRYQTAKEMLRNLAQAREASNAHGGLAVTTESMPLVATSALTPTVEATPAPIQPKRRPFRSLLANLKLGTGTIAAIASVSLALGLVWGWNDRTPNLLADDAPTAAGPPALWLDQHWRRIPRQNSPRDQLRHAQLAVSPAQQDAAWLAVPGYFPDQPEWAFQAYTQLARSLLRRRDTDRLAALAGALDRPEAPDRDQELATIARAGVSAIRADEGFEDQIRSQLTTLNFDYIHPTLVELSLEVTALAMQPSRGLASTSSNPLAKLRGDLIQSLRVDPADFGGWR